MPIADTILTPILTPILTVLLALLFTLTGRSKLVRNANSEAVREQLGMPTRLWRAIGACELGLVVAFVVSLWWLPAILVAAPGAMVLMVGAGISRLTAHARFGGVLIDVVVFILALTVGVLRTGLLLI